MGLDFSKELSSHLSSTIRRRCSKPLNVQVAKNILDEMYYYQNMLFYIGQNISWRRIDFGDIFFWSTVEVQGTLVTSDDRMEPVAKNRSF